LLAFLALTVPVAVIVLVVTILLVYGTVPIRPAFQRSEWAHLLRAVLPFAAAVAIGAVYLRITVVLMSLLASKVQTGYYATSFTVISVLIAIPALTVGSTLPILARAARDDAERLDYVMQRLFEVTLIVGVWLGLALALGAHFVIHVLAKEDSSAAAEVLQIQSLALITQFLASAWQYGLLSLHRHRALLMISIGSLLVSVVMTLILVPLLHAQGAAVAFSAAEVTLAISSFVLLKVAKPGLSFSLRVPVRVLLAAVLAGTVAVVPGLSSLAQALIASVVYLAVLVALRGIPVELMQALLRRTQSAGS
jgi:O-antigen/teichoic acid export membrane protein